MNGNDYEYNITVEPADTAMDQDPTWQLVWGLNNIMQSFDNTTHGFDNTMQSIQPMQNFDMQPMSPTQGFDNTMDAVSMLFANDPTVNGYPNSGPSTYLQPMIQQQQYSPIATEESSHQYLTDPEFLDLGNYSPGASSVSSSLPSTPGSIQTFFADSPLDAPSPADSNFAPELSPTTSANRFRSREFIIETGQPRHKQLLACIHCRRMKSKCEKTSAEDGSPCEKCSRDNLKCEYRPRGYGRKSLQKKGVPARTTTVKK